MDHTVSAELPRVGKLVPSRARTAHFKLWWD